MEPNEPNSRKSHGTRPDSGIDNPSDTTPFDPSEFEDERKHQLAHLINFLAEHADDAHEPCDGGVYADDCTGRFEAQIHELHPNWPSTSVPFRCSNPECAHDEYRTLDDVLEAVVEETEDDTEEVTVGA